MSGRDADPAPPGRRPSGQSPERPPGRRAFLGTLGAALGWAALPTAALRARTRPTDGDGSGPALAPTFDLHAHPGMFPAEGTPAYPGDAAARGTVEAARAAGLAGAFFALVADVRILERVPGRGLRASRPFEPGEAWEDYRRQMEVLRALLARSPARLATRADGLAGAPEAGGVAAFAAVEGGDPLEGRPGRLEAMHADGVRSVQLVHYTQNELGDLQTEPPRFGGLSEAGREVVAGMNRLGMVVDVAHASFDTVVDAAESSDDPLLLSHSLLKTGSGSPLEARLITAEHARVVAETGGVVGMWPAGPPNGDLDGFVENTLRLIDVVGVEHVGLGTDMDGGPSPVLNAYGQVGAWADGLRSGGLSGDEVAAVLGGNARRLLERVLA